MPVSTTVLSLTRSVIPSFISRMAFSGRVETSKFSFNLLQMKKLRCHCPAKSNHRTFVHFIREPFGRVILSAAKNLSERPFVTLRVTNQVYQSFVD